MQNKRGRGEEWRLKSGLKENQKDWELKNDQKAKGNEREEEEMKKRPNLF